MIAETVLNNWYNQTTLHPLGVFLLLLCAAATFLVPRRYALVPTLVLVCFVGSTQRIVIATLDFNFLRLMVLVGWTRVILRGEYAGWRWKRLDSVVLAWAICSTVVATMLHSNFESFITRLGLLYDAVGLYFLVRILVRGFCDLRTFAQWAAIISLPVAIAFLIEQSTGRNMFASFGGVAEITTIRDGRMRCRGPFLHPIIAGSFWAALMPLMAALWWYRGWNRFLALLGIAGAMVVVITCSSATPLGGVIAGVIAATLFPLRRWIACLRWGTVLGLLVLQLFMTNPIWHLLARVQLVSGSTGWYRYKLIDEFFRNINEWWLIGTETYSSWWEYGFDAVTNEYIFQGVEGGLLTLCIFLGIIGTAFWGVGKIWHLENQRRSRLMKLWMPRASTRYRRKYRQFRYSSGRLAMAWALGVSLFVHCSVFMGVSNFGQTIFVWYLTIACIGSLTPLAHKRRQVAKLSHKRLMKRYMASSQSEPIIFGT